MGVSTYPSPCGPTAQVAGSEKGTTQKKVLLSAERKGQATLLAAPSCRTLLLSQCSGQIVQSLADLARYGPPPFDLEVHMHPERNRPRRQMTMLASSQHLWDCASSVFFSRHDCRPFDVLGNPREVV
jgi:hypothetical protein